MTDLRNKTALITGSDRGIGRESSPCATHGSAPGW